jgi:hypothetical protein
MIFVFGSNESGYHGAGAAKTAHEKHGAIMGLGFGPAGYSFAIPTKDWRIGPLELRAITHYVERFIVYARQNPDKEFMVTALGCGLAGHRHDVIAPMFKYAPANCSFDELWHPFLGDKKLYWGTF